MGNFLKSSWGSYLKAFLAIIIAYMISKGSVFNINWSDLLNTSIISFLPMALKIINKEETGFFNTAIGGYLKSFIAIGIAYIVARGSIIGVDWRDFVNTVIMAFLPVLINVVNTKDDRYGIFNKTKPTNPEA